MTYKQRCKMLKGKMIILRKVFVKQERDYIQRMMKWLHED